MNAFPLSHIILLFGFVLILKVPLSASGLVFENNPFYGLSNNPIRSVESITDDNLKGSNWNMPLQQFKLVLQNFLEQLYFIMKKMKQYCMQTQIQQYLKMVRNFIKHQVNFLSPSFTLQMEQYFHPTNSQIQDNILLQRKYWE